MQKTHSKGVTPETALETILSQKKAPKNATDRYGKHIILGKSAKQGGSNEKKSFTPAFHGPQMGVITILYPQDTCTAQSGGKLQFCNRHFVISGVLSLPLPHPTKKNCGSMKFIPAAAPQVHGLWSARRTLALGVGGCVRNQTPSYPPPPSRAPGWVLVPSSTLSPQAPLGGSCIPDPCLPTPASLFVVLTLCPRCFPCSCPPGAGVTSKKTPKVAKCKGKRGPGGIITPVLGGAKNHHC